MQPFEIISSAIRTSVAMVFTTYSLSANAKLTDDEERANGVCRGTCG